MLRGFLAILAALVPLCLPVVGGSSGVPLPAPVPAWESPPVTAAEPPPAPAAVVSKADFPTFLHPLRGQHRTPPSPIRRPVRELLLSFDDGPDLLGTPMVLDELDRRGLKAIFFVNGRHFFRGRPQDLARRDLVQKLAAHGHLVANHTFNHKNLCQFPLAAAEEVDTNSELISSTTGVRPLLFRAPYGARCRSLDETLAARDLVQIGWNMDPQEWRAEDQDAVFTYVTGMLTKLNGRAILLLHDTHPAAVRALPRLLDWVEQENRRVSRDGGTPLRIVDYSVFLPERPVPRTGLEPIFDRIIGPMASSFGRLVE